MNTLAVITSKTPSQLEAGELSDAYDAGDYSELGRLYAKFIDNANTFNIHNEIFDIFAKGGR